MMRRTPLVGRAALLVVGLALSLSTGRAASEIVVVVSAKSSVTALSRAQIVDIFLGRASRFPDGSPAVPIDQKEHSAPRDQFYASYADYSPARLKAHWSKIIFTGRGQPPRQAADSNEVKQLVAGNPNAVGYIEHNAVDSLVKVIAAQ